MASYWLVLLHLLLIKLRLLCLTLINFNFIKRYHLIVSPLVLCIHMLLERLTTHLRRYLLYLFLLLSIWQHSFQFVLLLIIESICILLLFHSIDVVVLVHLLWSRTSIRWHIIKLTISIRGRVSHEIEIVIICFIRIILNSSIKCLFIVLSSACIIMTWLTKRCVKYIFLSFISRPSVYFLRVTKRIAANLQFILAISHAICHIRIFLKKVLK